MYILGAGLAGCLAAIRYESARVLERSTEPNVNHQAVLRMKTDTVSRLTGIPFRKVTIDKFILEAADGSVSLKHMIDYSIKVSGGIFRRSIFNLESEIRYIPPDDFHEQMLNRIDGRIVFNADVKEINSAVINASGMIFERVGMPIISTMPLSKAVDAVGWDSITAGIIPAKPIYVSRVNVENCDMFATVYCSSQSTPVYRITINGNHVIIESTGQIPDDEIAHTCRQIGIDNSTFTISMRNHRQEFGKIVPMADDWERKSLLYELTNKFGVYSLGRFACWRQIQLDDVVHDISVINKMMNVHPYDRSK